MPRTGVKRKAKRRHDGISHIEGTVLWTSGIFSYMALSPRGDIAATVNASSGRRLAKCPKSYFTGA